MKQVWIKKIIRVSIKQFHELIDLFFKNKFKDIKIYKRLIILVII